MAAKTKTEHGGLTFEVVSLSKHSDGVVVVQLQQFRDDLNGEPPGEPGATSALPGAPGALPLMAFPIYVSSDDVAASGYFPGSRVTVEIKAAK